VALQVEDGQGRLSDAAAKATVQLNVGAAPTAPADAPQIFFNGSAAINKVNVDNTDLKPGETVLFDASHSQSPAQNPIVTYTWTLNGQQAQTGPSARRRRSPCDGDNTIPADGHVPAAIRARSRSRRPSRPTSTSARSPGSRRASAPWAPRSASCARG
jgi:hypothetical protein